MVHQQSTGEEALAAQAAATSHCRQKAQAAQAPAHIRQPVTEGRRTGIMVFTINL